MVLILKPCSTGLFVLLRQNSRMSSAVGLPGAGVSPAPVTRGIRPAAGSVTVAVRGGTRLSRAHRRAGVPGRKPVPVWLRAVPGESPLEVLRRENELLKRSIDESESAIRAYEGQLRQAGVGYGAPVSDEVAVQVWSPECPPAPGGYFNEQYGAVAPIPDHDGTACFKWDDSLWSHADHFRYRWNVYRNIRNAIDEHEGGMNGFTQGYKYYGLNRGECNGRQGVWYREWAPAARAVALVGEFNNWEPKESHWAVKNDFGVWELFLADKPDGQPEVWHRCKIKSRVETCDG